jgi:hypothetical protein
MKPMNLGQVVRNIDRRLERVEQILPTLPTREDLDRTLDERIARLVTKEEFERKIDERVATLATKEELREEFERSRRHTEILFESLKGDIHLVAEGFAATQTELKQIVHPKLDSHDQRLTALEDAHGRAGGGRRSPN